MKIFRNSLVNSLLIIFVILVISICIYAYFKSTLSQPNLIENSNIALETSTNTNNIVVTSTTTKNSTKVSSSPKSKFDPYAPMLKIFPGVYGTETIDLTKVNYPPCAIASTRAEYHPRQLDLKSKVGLIVQEDRNYYDVSSTNEFYMLYEIWNCTIPLQGMSSGADAVTESYLNYNFLYDPINNQVCNINDVSVGVHISYLLPKWIHVGEASGELLNIWNRYFTIIQKHEERHGSIAKEYGNKLYLYLMELSNSKTCVPSMDIINNEYDEIIKELNVTQAKYDLDVDHGIKEGILLPFDNIIRP